jgi:hypothetical protein
MSARAAFAAVAIVAAAATLCAPRLGAQPRIDAAEVTAWLGGTVPALEAEIACDVTVHGAPRYDDFSSQWLVAYSAAGDACDDMSVRLLRYGEPVGVAFYRRPNAEQVKNLISRTRRTVELAFACRIVLKSEPRFEETSSLWIVEYASPGGADCSGAAGELARAGRELGIAFWRVG